MTSGQQVKISRTGQEYLDGRIGTVAMTIGTRISPYSGSAYSVVMVTLTSEGRFQDRSFELNSDCLEVI